ncbi:hypothetical protein HYFRA_00005666 [Hymenoscyphus fraxineus]|uniref:SsuA/THI5-like domain-containing protein n=1 Tax=Hymenoscyphus fraxineus TaxID=746836 RepID=A0A9N9PRV4_9HELO|nr:hypothetical protein HYFRA_00005666 [Hymenoscyphus fraxineus]
MKPPLHLPFLPLLPLLVHSLKIASSLQWIEHTPQPYTLTHFYHTPSVLTTGGVANLTTDPTIDLAANAETQGLKQYAVHKNLRLIYVLVEVPYRLVAHRNKNKNKNNTSSISKLADLKGKKIGTFPGTSAEVFVDYMMGSVGVKKGEYEVVKGDVCMKAPCSSGTLPSMLKRGEVDGFGIWEASVELGAQALGDNAVLFQNGSLYREVYSLYTTVEKLGDSRTRGELVAFLKALDRTLGVFRRPDESVYRFVAEKVGMDPGVVRDVWGGHVWTGGMPGDLLEFLVREDAYLAESDGRAGVSRAELETFIDSSVLAEASKT